MNKNSSLKIYHANVNANLSKENVIQIQSGIMINVNAGVKNICEKHILNPAACSCKNGKYLASVIDNSVSKCDEIKEKKQFQQTLIKKVDCKTQNF